ncbi:endonuclease SmrB [Buchnera aphidicola]|uniref:endonuclease SmrB n=1 Tax=Buchnera aphidicola TaxID=9 RepID=UPI003464C762
MSKSSSIIFEDNFIFNQFINGTKKIVQDTIYHSRISKQGNCNFLRRKIHEAEAHAHYFSSYSLQTKINDGSGCYVRNDTNKKELYDLKKGKYNPDIFLDLHGLTRYEAKRELGKLIAICREKHFFCAGIIHGHGKHILKQETPLWLSKHPDIIAFYRSSKVFGNGAAIIFLIEIDKN